MSKKLQIVGALKIPQSDWNQTDDTQMDYIKNKPDYDALVERVEGLEALVKELSAKIEELTENN